MNNPRTKRLAAVVALSVLAIALLASATACKEKKESTKQKERTAKTSLTVAESALSTMAPDAKLLLVQTAEAVTPTSTPVWAYLFGSPKSDSTYLVYVADGRAMGASEYGKAGLSDKEWAKVPDDSAWKVDSDAAYDKAVDAADATGTPAAYLMGMQTYVPESAAKSATQTADAFTWYVSFDFGGKQATMVEVDAKTGKAEAREATKD